jgi:hypothetical protein
MKEGEKHHLKGRIVQMEEVSNLCASSEATNEKTCKKSMTCPWQSTVANKPQKWP